MMSKIYANNLARSNSDSSRGIAGRGVAMQATGRDLSKIHCHYCNTFDQDGTAEPVSRDQILRHARGQGNIHFPCSADHEQDWQPYPVDPYSAICDDHTYIHTYYKNDRADFKAARQQNGRRRQRQHTQRGGHQPDQPKPGGRHQ